MLRRVLLATALAALVTAGGHPGTTMQAGAARHSPVTSVAFVEPPECPYQGPHSLIHQGMTGPAVAHLQCLLNRVWGYSVPIDGVAGPATGQAVKAHQADCGVVVDGVVGVQTWNILHPATAPAACRDERSG